MKKKNISTLIAAVLAAMLTGCGFGTSAENLLTPPMMSERQGEIYNALTEAAGENITLVYPRSGAYRSAFVFADLDGDGTDEAVAFYDDAGDTETGVRVNIIDIGEDGITRSVYDHAGAGVTVEEVFFTDLGGRGKTRMAIGYGYMTPAEKTLRVYSFENGVLNTEYSGSYYKTLTMDLDRDGGEDIIMIGSKTENQAASVSLVTDKGNGVICEGTVSMSENAADIPSVTGGSIGEGTPALFADVLMGSGDISTEIIYCVNGQLRNPANVSGSEIRSLTTRSAGLYSRDVDGDGIVEIPSREPFPGYRENYDMQYITNWNVFENYTIIKKYSSLTRASQGYCFMLPVRWEGLVTVKTDPVTGEKVFYKFNNSLAESRLELMRILVCSPQEAREKLREGYIIILGEENLSDEENTASNIHMVKFSDTEDNLLLTEAEVRNNYYRY